MAEDYITVAEAATAELVERRSRFIATVQPVADEAQAQALIAATRKEFWDARHVVYAYALHDGQTRRYSDDGEPQGTAGLPVLDVLQRRGWTDCLLTVTRYFGGVLLGTGGLTRAYSGAASLAAEAARPVWMRRCVQVQVTCDYAAYGFVLPLLSAHGTVTDSDFADEVVLRALIPQDAVPAMTHALTEQSAGRLSPTILGETAAPFPMPSA